CPSYRRASPTRSVEAVACRLFRGISRAPRRWSAPPPRRARPPRRPASPRVPSNAESGSRCGPFDVEELLTAPFLVVSFASAAQTEQPLREQQIDHGCHIDGKGQRPSQGDALGQLVNLQRQEYRGGHHREILTPARQQPQS